MNVFFAVQDPRTEQLGIMMLSSMLKKAGHDVEIIEARYDKVAARLRRSGFAVLAYGTTTRDVRAYLGLNSRIKEGFRVFSIFGGPHPTIFPEVIEEPGVDAVCVGEGEYALVDLANKLAENGCVTDIKDLSIKKDGRIFPTSGKLLIDDLDSLPFADRSLFKGGSYKHMATSRGCPYRCSYCCERGRFRRRSVDNVVEECKRLKTGDGCDFLFFTDPVFDLSLPWVEDFSKKYRKEAGFPFYFHTRANLITTEAVRCLKEANCRYISIGIETANDRLRNDILKKDLSKEEIISAAEIVKKEGIKLRTTVMLGLPSGTIQDDLETLALNIRCRADYTEAHALFIHRGLEIYDRVDQDPRLKPARRPARPLYFYYETLSASEASQIKNLHRIFGLITSMPFLFTLTRALIRLPLQRLYLYLYYIWEGLYHYFGIFRRYRGPKGFFSGAMKYMRVLHEAGR